MLFVHELFVQTFCRPYHHGREVWYNNNMQNGAIYVMCGGESADGEDSQCSDSLPNIEFLAEGVNDHGNYFGHNISTYCNIDESTSTVPTGASSTFSFDSVMYAVMFLFAQFVN